MREAGREGSGWEPQFEDVSFVEEEQEVCIDEERVVDDVTERLQAVV